MLRGRRARSAVAIAAGAAVLATVPLFIHHAPAPRDVRARGVRAAAAWSAAAPPQPAPSAGGKTPRDAPAPEAEAAALRRLAVTRPLAEITEEIQGEVKKRLEKEKEVVRTHQITDGPRHGSMVRNHYRQLSYVHEFGHYQKQSSMWSNNKACLAQVEGNMVFNGPRVKPRRPPLHPDPQL